MLSTMKKKPAPAGKRPAPRTKPVHLSILLAKADAGVGALLVASRIPRHDSGTLDVEVALGCMPESGLPFTYYTSRGVTYVHSYQTGVCYRLTVGHWPIGVVTPSLGEQVYVDAQPRRGWAYVARVNDNVVILFTSSTGPTGTVTIITMGVHNG